MVEDSGSILANVSPDMLSVQALGETRSGCRIDRIAGRSGDNEERMVVFKEGATEKLVEEKVQQLYRRRNQLMMALSAVAVATLPAIADCVSRAPGWRPPLPNMSETTARCGSLTTRSTAPPGRVSDGPRTGRPARARTSSGRNALVPSRRRVVPALGLWGGRARESELQQPLGWFGCYGRRSQENVR